MDHHKNSVPEILFPVNDLNAINEDGPDENNTTTEVSPPTHNPSARLRKRSFLSPSRKLSVDGWVDITVNNVIKEEEGEGDQAKEAPALEGDITSPSRSVTPTNARMKRVSFERHKRSLSTDSWVDLDTDDADFRLVLFTNVLY